MDEEQLEEWAFYESGLVAHGCLENIDEYMREAITRYGRLLLSKQRIKDDTLTNEPAWKSWDWPTYTPFKSIKEIKTSDD